MTVNKISLVYFSPTGTTRQMVRAIAEALPMPVEEYDSPWGSLQSPPSCRWTL